jgi:type I restriction enzyme S subunit
LLELPLGRVLQRERRPVVVDSHEQYVQIGVRSFGKGFFIKEAVSGANIGKKKLFRIADGDIVFNIVFAWEGAVALAGPLVDALTASHRFPTYRVDTDECAPRWLEQALKSRDGVAAMSACSPGSAGRNRTLNQEQLMEWVVRLPASEVQKEQLRLMDAALAYEAAADVHARAAKAARNALVRAEAASLRERYPAEPLGELADLQIGRTPSRSRPDYWTTDLERPFCTIASMRSREVTPIKEGVTALAEEQGKAKRIPAGSLLMSFKLTLGKVGFAACDLFPNEAIVRVEPYDADRTSTNYLAPILETTDFTALTGEAVKGKTLNRGSLARIPVPIVSADDAVRLARLTEGADSFVEAARTTADTAAQVVVALREKLFAGCLSRPGYSTLVEAA